MAFIIFIISIDPRYHTFNEVAYELDSIAEHYSTIALLDTIGYSTSDSLPIFALKITDNINSKEDEPQILYIACHHAEEILGIELCMYMINDLIANYMIDSTKTYWINNSEIWFVPLLNPEGHGIVMQEIDTTWRKNKKDNNNNGQFDLDYDGVDLNRNYDFHWHDGGSTDPSSEYYRGPAPVSENEVKALQDLCLQKDFIFCNTYHSARTGLGEVIYYPWRTSSGFSPDFLFIRDVSANMARLIINDQGNGHYLTLPGVNVDGRARNWLYGVRGTYTFCVEISTTCIQPGWMVDDICARNAVGAYYLLDRVKGSGITGCIRDDLTGEPLIAEVIVENYYDPYLPPRLSNADFGRFTRILTPGFYDIEIRKKGYASICYQNVKVQDDIMTDLSNISLKRTTGSLIFDDRQDEILFYPNPTKNSVTICLTNPLNITSVKIYNTIGRLIEAFDDPQNEIIWQCTDKNNRKIPNGVYWLIGETKEKSLLMEKVIIVN